MAILKVARLGHPVLRRVAKPVDVKEIQTKEFQQFIDDMIDTMHEYAGIGLAAPQVHQSVRVSVIEFEDEISRKNKDIPRGVNVFINPELTVLTENQSASWEGCLSVPGMRGLVARPNKVRVKYLDREGKQREFTTEGYLAIVLQHEFDHLDGKLYVDRLVDSTKLVYEEEFEKYWLPDAEDTEILD